MEGIKRFLFVSDWLLSRIVRKLFDFTIHVALLIVGFSTFWISIRLIFEYGEGLSDISRLEWWFCGLSLLLLWRYRRQLDETENSEWPAIRAPLLLAGKLSFILCFIVLFAFSVSVDHESSYVALNTFFVGSDFQLSIMSIVLASLYLSSPEHPTSQRLMESGENKNASAFAGAGQSGSVSDRPTQPEVRSEAKSVAKVHPNGDIEFSESRTV
ncbi:hypothetical protein [Ferrimonas gelatinilytica]|uniref:hypothetical protein n=1 Tax=Ferrimonas gelatinilytica TaxID=1255257 RepID=UPI0031E7574D